MKIFEQKKKKEKKSWLPILRGEVRAFMNICSPFGANSYWRVNPPFEPTDIKLNNCKKEHEASSFMLIKFVFSNMKYQTCMFIFSWA